MIQSRMSSVIKANELVERFMYSLMVITNISERFPIAKECAVQCVDEIMNQQYSVGKNIDESLEIKVFWEQTKEVIKNLTP